MTVWETEVKYDIAESGIYPMNTGELLSLLPADEQEATHRALLDLRLGYSEARGTEALRAEIASTYTGVCADEVLVTTGAIEANYLIFTTLLSAGDHVVAVYPAYQQLFSVARAVGCDVTLWTIEEADGEYRFDVNALEGLLRADTKMIVINTPHNPTGAYLTDGDLARVYDLAEERGAVVLCDEAYRWLDLPGGVEATSPLRNRGTTAISVGTVSKPFGLPGLRIGWIAATEEIAQKCWAARDYVSLSPGKISDFLALIAIQHRDLIQQRNERILEPNLATADAWFAENADVASWNRPKAGLLALMKYTADMPSAELADHLARDYSVMLAPGSAFGYEGHLRIGVGQEPSIFAKGLEEAARCFRALR